MNNTKNTMENKWRFPGNGYTQDQGLDTADMEAFKKDPISSLARELCQNSIDAKKASLKRPVRIEFKSFSIKREEIPQIEAIDKQILACKDTWTTNKKISDQLEKMYDEIQQKEICCLRISDFNTKGLIGVSGGDDTPWHYMIHGSGLSNKSATSGGSKGIGKYATFVTSSFNTVFYSTVTEANETGYQGICKLCSAKQEGTTEKTIGIGYFGASDKNEPILGEFNIDPSFNRKGQTGTDIFILGFKNASGWKTDIISKILESFISAIVFGDLEVSIEDVVMNKDTLKDIVFNEEIINKVNRKSIVSQYLLLTDVEHRYEDVIDLNYLGKVKLYLMEFEGENENLATNGCVMIRYPYMKIRDIEKISTLPCSAMCIIEDNKLNAMLRNIENAQHTNWEFNRIEDDKERAMVREVYRLLLEGIKERIFVHLSSSMNFQTDVVGAGDFIPGSNGEVEVRQEDSKRRILDKPTITTKKVKSKPLNINVSTPDENEDELVDEKTKKDGKKKTSETSIHTLENSNEDRPNAGKPQNLARYSELKGMAYRLICVDKKMQIYDIIFTSTIDEPSVILELYALDDSGAKTQVLILACTMNGERVNVIDRRKINFSIHNKEKIKLEMITDQSELFSSEVKLYACR